MPSRRRRASSGASARQPQPQQAAVACQCSSSSSSSSSSSGGGNSSLLLSALPEHLLERVLAHIPAGCGSRDNARSACQAFCAGLRAGTTTLDLYELLAQQQQQQAQQQQQQAQQQQAALRCLASHPNVRSVVLPSGWREPSMVGGTLCAPVQLQLRELALHFQALSPAMSRQLAALAPGLTRLHLCLDLAFEATSKQAARVAALCDGLPRLRSLVVAADLRPEALELLTCLRSLQELRLTAGSCHAGSVQPGRSLRAICRLQQLTALTLSWTAGRSMGDAAPLTGLTSLRCLHVWLGASGQALPPCSAKPLPGLLTAIGQLGGLTELRLLRGLYMSLDLRKVRHLDRLTQLQVLCLNDSVLGEEELALLAPCQALTHLRLDTLRLSAATPVLPERVGASDGPMACALQTLGRLRRLHVNMLSACQQLPQLCPALTALAPLPGTLGAGGHGVVMDLGLLAHHPRLASLGLMLGALGTTCSCSRAAPPHGVGCSESLATAVVRVLLSSTGLARLSAGQRAGVSMQQLLELLATLPALTELHLFGQAGGLSGKALASLEPACSASSSATLHGGAGCCRQAARRRRSSSHGVAAAMCSLLGPLLAPVRLVPGAGAEPGQASCSRGESSGGYAAAGEPQAGQAPPLPPPSQDKQPVSCCAARGDAELQHDGPPPGRQDQRPAGPASGGEHALVVALLHALPGLRLLQLHGCRHLPSCGRALAAATCGRCGAGRATVAVAPEHEACGDDA